MSHSVHERSLDRENALLSARRRRSVRLEPVLVSMSSRARARRTLPRSLRAYRSVRADRTDRDHAPCPTWALPATGRRADGHNHAVISRIESGRHRTGADTLRRLAKALDSHALVGFEFGSGQGPRARASGSVARSSQGRDNTQTFRRRGPRIAFRGGWSQPVVVRTLGGM